MDPAIVDNYFNYFTEIERHYQSKRESFTLLSTLDWALIETWKDRGIPLELVLKGMDRAFSKAKSKVGSLAYCANAVARVIEEQKDLRSESPAPPQVKPEKIREYLGGLSSQVRALEDSLPEFAPRFASIAEAIATQDISDLRAGESALNALEEKLTSIIEIAADESTLIEVRDEVERGLAPVRSRMTVDQLAMLDRQLWKRKIMERHGVGRLSLFYLI